MKTEFFFVDVFAYFLFCLCRTQFPADADPLPQGVPLKPLIKSLKKEVHHLRRKLKRAEGDLQASRKNATEATKEVTRLRGLYTRATINMKIQKEASEKELAELQKRASDKSWELRAQVTSLEADLKKAGEKISLLEGSSPWSTEKARYDWDWSKKFSDLQEQLRETEKWHNHYRITWTERMWKLGSDLKAAKRDVSYFQKKLQDAQQIQSDGESSEMASLRRIAGELSEAIRVEKAEVQRLKLQIVDEHRAAKDAEAESEVLRKQRREFESKYECAHRQNVELLFRLKELEDEILRLKEALVMAGADSPKSEGSGPS